MKPRVSADCISIAVWTALAPHEREELISRIEQLVAVERAIAAQEMHEAHVRQAGALLHKPLSEEEAEAGGP